MSGITCTADQLRPGDVIVNRTEIVKIVRLGDSVSIEFGDAPPAWLPAHEHVVVQRDDADGDRLRRCADACFWLAVWGQGQDRMDALAALQALVANEAGALDHGWRAKVGVQPGGAGLEALRDAARQVVHDVRGRRG